MQLFWNHWPIKKFYSYTFPFPDSLRTRSKNWNSTRVRGDASAKTERSTKRKSKKDDICSLVTLESLTAEAATSSCLRNYALCFSTQKDTVLKTFITQSHAKSYDSNFIKTYNRPYRTTIASEHCTYTRHELNKKYWLKNTYKNWSI